MDLLILLVEHKDQLVSREEIIERLWGQDVFLDTEQGINTAIRKIRQVLRDDPERPRFVQTVFGRGYRFIGPITVVNNYADVLVPTASSSRTWLGRRTKITLIAAGLAIVLLFALFAIHRNMLAVSGDTEAHLVIAVVPLENLSGDPGQDFFVQGLTEEVITQLGQLNPDRIGVVKYGKSPAVQQTTSMIPDLRQQAGLQYLLEGSVRRQDERARISIRLVRVADETTVWTESFDRNVGDVLSLQSEIANRIGRELQIRVLTRANRKPAEPAVVESYLRGRFELARHIMPVPDAAGEYFRRAITLDPSYAPAYAGLADFYRSRGVGENGNNEQNWRLAAQYATQALSLDSDSAETHTAIAQIKLMHDWDWQAAREHALRALQLNPSSPDAHSVYARYLRIAGNMGEAVSHRKQAVALDPLREDLKIQLSLEYFFARDYKSPVALARQELADNPNDQFSHGVLCNDLGYLGRFDESVAACGKFLALIGHADWVPAYVREYHKSGYEAASQFLARKDLNEILKRQQPDLWGLANAYVLAGMPEEALRTLFQALPVHDPGLLQIRVDPEFDSIRDHPRYAELIRQIGFPTE